MPVAYQRERQPAAAIAATVVTTPAWKRNRSRRRRGGSRPACPSAGSKRHSGQAGAGPAHRTAPTAAKSTCSPKVHRERRDHADHRRGDRRERAGKPRIADDALEIGGAGEDPDEGRQERDPGGHQRRRGSRPQRREGLGRRSAASCPMNWLTRIVGPGVVSASPSPSTISPASPSPSRRPRRRPGRPGPRRLPRR